MLGFDPKAARATWTAALVLLFLYLVYVVREVLLVVTIAVLFAYLLYPIVDLLDRRLPGRLRAGALAITYAMVLGVIGLFGSFIGSVVAEQATSLAQKAPELVKQMKQRASAPAGEPKGWKEQAIGTLENAVEQHYSEIAAQVPKYGLQILSASGNLIYVILVPIISFFILKDGRAIRDKFIGQFDKGQDAVRETLIDVHTLLLSYMRAQLFLCLATLVTFAIVLHALGVPYAILLAVIAFPLEFIPLVGPLGAAVIITSVSIFSGYPHVLWVVSFLALFRLFQDYVLSPHLMSSGVELHPLMVIIGVIAGGEVGGVAGSFLSVPVLALLRLLVHDMRKRQRAKALQVQSV